MWKGLKKALGPRAKAQKTSTTTDASQRSTASSTAQSSTHGGAMFALDISDVDALFSSAEQPMEQQHQQSHQQQLGGKHNNTNNQQQPVAAAAQTWAQLQAQLQQQHAVQQLMQQTEDSTSKRRAAAIQKRSSNSMLNPSTCMYQIRALLSLSTLFEHKLQRDTLQALQQQPSNLVASITSALVQQQQQQAQALQHKQQQQQQLLSSSTLQPHLAGDVAAAASSAGAPCLYCQGLAGTAADGSQAAGAGSSVSSCCCGGGSGGAPRAPSATAASTAHVALLLASWGYRVIVRKVVHSKAYWTKSMDNTFIVALDSSSGNHVEYVVDPHFQEAFNVGVMSDNYRAVWAALPRVFVGMPCQLQSAVQLLCEEMELSFLEAGRPCPPWRGWAATINRWMSDQFVDILVPEPGASSDEVAEYLARCTQLAGCAGGPPGAVGSAASSAASTATRGSSTCGLSTCSPPGGNVSQQRLGDKVHVSSVLSSVSGARDRRVPEPLQQQVGFASSDGGAAGQGAPRDSSSCLVNEQQLEQHQQMLELLGREQQQPRDEQPLDRRSTTSNSSGCSLSSGLSSTAGSSSPSGCPAGRRSRSLLTAQMQFKQGQEQQQQPPAGNAALQQALFLQQQQQLMLLQQQQQQQAMFLQQQQQGQVPPQVHQQQAQQLQHMQQLLLMQQQQQQRQQQQHMAGCAPLLPVVHTVRPCGTPAAPPVPAAAAAMHAAALQQLLPLQQRLHQQQLQQQQQPVLQPSMHNSPEEQPKLLRLIARPKAA